MTASGAPKGEVKAKDMNVAIVASSWHDSIVRSLIEGSQRACTEAGAKATVFRVAGSFELPVVALACAQADFEAVVALGVIIRGNTPHFEYVCQAATDGLTRVALDTGVPVGYGLLTCDTEGQALARAGRPASSEDKGAESAQAAIGAALVLRGLRAG
jgi:6,7-dimethyl-8-ribityllumazine synthase